MERNDGIGQKEIIEDWIQMEKQLKMKIKRGFIVSGFQLLLSLMMRRYVMRCVSVEKSWWVRDDQSLSNEVGEKE